MRLELTPIGTIHTPHREAKGTPIQPRWAAGAEGTIELLPEFVPGLQDLDGFERIWLVYWFDRAKTPELQVVPYLDTKAHGVFATRSPSRPNPIGLSTVRLLGIEGNRLRVADLDMLDGTPLLDIKPYVPDCDTFPVRRIGCFVDITAIQSADDRFTRKDSGQ